MPCKLVQTNVYPAAQRSKEHLTNNSNRRILHEFLFSKFEYKHIYIMYQISQDGTSLGSYETPYALEAFEHFTIQLDFHTEHWWTDLETEWKRADICGWLYGWEFRPSEEADILIVADED